MGFSLERMFDDLEHMLNNKELSKEEILNYLLSQKQYAKACGTL